VARNKRKPKEALPCPRGSPQWRSAAGAGGLGVLRGGRRGLQQAGRGPAPLTGVEGSGAAEHGRPWARSRRVQMLGSFRPGAVLRRRRRGVWRPGLKPVSPRARCAHGAGAIWPKSSGHSGARRTPRPGQDKIHAGKEGPLSAACAHRRAPQPRPVGRAMGYSIRPCVACQGSPLVRPGSRRPGGLAACERRQVRARAGDGPLK
jgi:hypothetical protein